jgi:ribosomal-protein-alanine N-acetyltransferase
VNLVHASALHAPVLAALHAESFPKAWIETEFRTLLSQPGVAAWIAGEIPNGFILVRAVAEEAEILTLAVSPAHRRAKIGTALVEKACAHLARAKIQKLFLEVAADNAAALALYGGAGFTPCGRRPGYYTGTAATDAVVMIRNIVG